MYLPQLKFSKKSQPIVINQFGGLNRTETIEDNEFSDMKNCGGRCFPHVAPREKRKILKKVTTGKIKAVAPLLYGGADMTESDFVGVIDDNFYYKNVSKAAVSDKLQYPWPYSDEVKYPQYGGKSYGYSIVPFNGVYCIFPGYKQFDPVSGTVKDIVKKFTSKYLYFWCDGSDQRYTTTSSYTTDLGTASDFKVGDRIVIYYDAKGEAENNCTFDSLDPEFREELYKNGSKYITSAFINKLEMNSSSSDYSDYIAGLHLTLRNAKGETVKFNNGVSKVSGTNNNYYYRPSGNVTIQKYAPPIVFACECGGRIWGLDPFGAQIMCCRAGNASDWSGYDGSAAAPWFTEVASNGEWTGIAEFNGNVYCFKRDVCHVVYGDNSTNFAIAKTINHGCIDAKSLCVIGTSLYFLGNDGFYVCSGSQAVKISEKLGRKYTGCVAGARGSLYYASCRYDGGSEMLVYDTEKNIWWREDETKAVDFFNYEDKLYCASDGEFFMIGDGELPDEWYVVSREYDDATSQLRSLCSLLFRLKLSAGADATVYVSYDGGEFVQCGDVVRGKLVVGKDNSAVTVEDFDEETLHRAESAYYQRIPVRFRASSSYKFKLVCHGDAVLEAVERSVTANGKYSR